MAKCCPCVHHQIEESKKTENINAQPKEDDIVPDDNFIIEHFKLPPRPLYLDPFRRPLITFPMVENSQHFSMARKYKINQQILDGYLDPSEAITAPPIFPYPKKEKDKIGKYDDVQIIFQLSEGHYKCPVHNKTVGTPRILGCCTCLKSESKSEARQRKKSDRPYKRPKPWLLSRHTDFDLISQW
ncbi:uncharacterized protein LOC121738780 isoform X2 [Aricia agestis]|uniref:uncharacterized protein LOC121738780 isoform X2 n=1 Tax=Aricia agestis TaxID=91739 RepID=UPI001C20A4D7|nr:uncharacterized protein LOC121738780 isoform X2 [Aricia agestis]